MFAGLHLSLYRAANGFCIPIKNLHYKLQCSSRPVPTCYKHVLMCFTWTAGGAVTLSGSSHCRGIAPSMCTLHEGLVNAGSGSMDIFHRRLGSVICCLLCECVCSTRPAVCSLFGVFANWQQAKQRFLEQSPPCSAPWRTPTVWRMHFLWFSGGFDKSHMWLLQRNSLKATGSLVWWATDCKCTLGPKSDVQIKWKRVEH